MLLTGVGNLVTKHVENAKIICGFIPVSLGKDCPWASQVPGSSDRFYGSIMGENEPVADLDAGVYLSTNEN